MCCAQTDFKNHFLKSSNLSSFRYLTLLFLLFTVKFAGAADRHWIGASSSNWSIAANWSATAGGAGGASVPGVNDHVYFNPQNPVNCWIGSAIEVASIHVKAGYNAVISHEGTIKVSNSFIFESGTFYGKTDPAVDIIVKGAFTLSGGQFHASSGTLEISGNPTFNSTFNPNGGKVRINFTNHCTVQAAAGKGTFNNLEFRNTVAGWISSSLSSATALQVSGNLEFTGTQKVGLNQGTIEVKKDVLLSNTASGGGGSTIIILSGSTDQTIKANSLVENQSALPAVRVNKSSGTLNLEGNITLGSDFKVLSGSINAGTSSVSSISEGDASFEGIFSFYKFCYKPIWNGTLYMTSSTNLTVLNDFTIGGSYNATLNTGTITAKGNIYNYNNGDNDWGSAIIVISGTADQAIVGNQVLNKGKLPGITINKPSGTLVLPAMLNVTGNWTYVQGSIDGTTNNSTIVFAANNTISGSHSLNNVVFSGRYTSNYVYSLSGGTVLSTTGSLSLEGLGNLAINGGEIKIGGDLIINNSAVSGGGSTLMTFSGTGDQRITGSVAAKQSRLPSVKIQKTSGKLIFPSVMSVEGNWNYQSGELDVTTNNSTVVFNGRQNFLGINHELNNVTFLAENNEYVDFGNSQLTVKGLLKFDGTAPLHLNSTSSLPSIYVKGDILISSTSIDGSGAAIIEVTGTGDQQLTGNAAIGGILPAISINKPSGILTLSNVISVHRGWKHITGSVDPGSSTVVFTLAGNSKELNGGTMRFNKLKFISREVYLKSDLHLDGDLVLTTGTLYSESRTISLKGSWESTSKDRFIESSGTVEFSGTTAQSISSAGGENFYNLKISGAGLKTLANDVTITSKLYLETGVLQTGSNKVIIPSSASVEGGSSQSYINGFLQKSYSTGSGISKVFEIGNASAYLPVTLSFPTVSSAGSVTVRAVQGEHPQIASSGLDAEKALNSYWVVSTSGVAPLAYNLGLAFTGAATDNGSDYNKFKVGFYNGSWQEKTVVSRTSSGIQLNNLNSAGEFQIAEPLLAGISISASLSGELCSGTSITFTATAQNGGSSPSYQWKVNNTNVGTNSSTFTTASLSRDSKITCVITSSFPLISVSATSNELAPKIGPVKWLGIASSAWNDAANWCGKAPSSSDDVTISATATVMPIITGASECRSLTIETGATLTLSSGVLKISGDLMNDGILEAGSNPVIFNGNGDQTLGGQSENQFQTVTFEGGGTKDLNASVKVADLLNVGNNTTLSANGKLTLLATSASNANLGPLKNNAKVEGHVQVQSFFSGGDLSYRGTRTISSPIVDAEVPLDNTFRQLQKSILITGPGGEANGFDKGGTINPNGASLLRYNEPANKSQNQYIDVTHINQTVAPGEGFYLYYRGDRSKRTNKVNAPYAHPENTIVTYKGPVNQGDVVKNLSYNYFQGEPFNGYNLVGNPYPSTIDWERVIRTNTSSEIKIIKPSGGYVTYIEGESVPESGNYRYIQPGQGFFVKATAPEASIRFTEDSKETINAPGRLLAVHSKESISLNDSRQTSRAVVSASPARQRLRFTLQDGKNTEEALIVFEEGKSALAKTEDASFFGGSTASLSSLSSDSVKLAINFMPDISEVSRLALHVDGASGDLDLSFTEFPAITGKEIYLKDHFANKIVNVKEQKKYRFSIDRKQSQTFGLKRFELLFTPPGMLPSELLRLNATKKVGAVLVDWNLFNLTPTYKYVIERSANTIYFEKIGEVNAAGLLSYSFLDRDPLPGSNYYRVKQVNYSGKPYYTDAVEVRLTDQEPEISVFPNPVTAILSVKFPERAIPVDVRIFSLSGQLVKQKSFKETEPLVLDVQDLTGGLYVLQLTDAEGKLSSKVKFVKK